MDDEAPELQRLLDDIGVTNDELTEAIAGGADAIALLIAGHVALPGPRRYTARAVWERAGVSEDEARSLWRAMGFPQLDDHVPSFTDADVDALAQAARVFARMGLDTDVALQQARAMSQALARVAEAQQDIVSSWMGGVGSLDLGHVAVAAGIADDVLPALDRLVVYLYRRHLVAAAERHLLLRAVGAGDATVTVGFADLVGFTAVSQQLDEQALARLVDEFTAVAGDVVAEAGGRVVKMIGDEVMFTTTDPAGAASIALDLVDRFRGSDVRPALRVGLAAGPVIAREGDLFGPTVNLASRLVNVARPSTVVVNEAVSEALQRRDDLVLKPLKSRNLKGIGPTHLAVLRRAESG